MKKFNSLKDYLQKYKIVGNEISTNEEYINVVLSEIKNKNSNLNYLINNLVNENELDKLNEVGKLLNDNGIKLIFNMQNPSSNNLEILKVYLKYSDESTCSNKGNVIKALIKAEDLEGIDILIDTNFINNRNVDKYLNFAINSGKYKVVPKLIEKKNA
ncbi:MAG: hypothetical protein ACRDCW_06435 [Sarcina sp.]